MIRYKRIHQFCAESGYTDAAVRGKIRDGVWMEGREWRRAPDGHILIDVEGYERWVESGNPGQLFGPVSKPSKQGSRHPRGLSPPPLVLGVKKKT